MGMSCYAAPILPPPEIEDIDERLKLLIVQSAHLSRPLDIEMGEDWLQYLRGLRDAGVEDADTLIDMIKKYKKVRVYEE